MYTLRLRERHQTSLTFPVCKRKLNGCDAKENKPPAKKLRKTPKLQDDICSPKKVDTSATITPSGGEEQTKSPSREHTPLKLCQARTTRTPPPSSTKKATVQRRLEFPNVDQTPRRHSRPTIPPHGHPSLSSPLINRAKKALNPHLPPSLPCREEETERVRSFLDGCLGDRGNPRSLYVSGAPGTGKTAVVTKILGSHKFMKKYSRVAVISCMDVDKPQDIFRKIAEELFGSKLTSKKHTTIQETIIKRITPPSSRSDKEMNLLVLDEIDQLSSKGQEVLYSIFEWPTLQRSNLVLIGIANTLDMTDRLLPRLHSRARLRPSLLHFAPYSSQEILSILRDRLVGVAGGVAFQPSALQLCARKVAASHGDMRRALSICRQSLESVELRLKHQKQTTTADITEPTTADPTGLAPQHACAHTYAGHEQLPPSVVVVTLRDMAATLSSAYPSSGGSCASVVETLPLHPKLVVCTLVLLGRPSHVRGEGGGGGEREVTVGRLYRAYRGVCRARQVRPEEEGGLVGVCSMLSDRGVVCLRGSKEPSLAKVSLLLQESEVEHILKDQSGLFNTVLSQGLPSL